ncbi:MAG TPA: hypothetical protein VG605_08815 [Puia sp.]|nr:hypothetical protein [Puia sp.]
MEKRFFVHLDSPLLATLAESLSMDGEFRIQLKNYDSHKIIEAFIEYYGDHLDQAYNKSAYYRTGDVKRSDICAGYQTSDSLFLVYNREGNYLKVYVEPSNKKDINLMKELINRYFKSVTQMLDNKHIKWHKPQATITLEECPLPGIYKTKKEALKEIFEDQREKVVFTPIGTFLAIFIARYLSIMDKIDAGKDAEKALTSTLEALIVVLLLIVCQVFLVSTKRVFTFKI